MKKGEKLTQSHGLNSKKITWMSKLLQGVHEMMPGTDIQPDEPINLIHNPPYSTLITLTLTLTRLIQQAGSSGWTSIVGPVGS